MIKAHCNPPKDDISRRGGLACVVGAPAFWESTVEEGAQVSAAKGEIQNLGRAAIAE